MDRRQFIKLGGFITVSAATSGLAGCGGSDYTPPAPGLPPAAGANWKFPQSVASGDPRAEIGSPDDSLTLMREVLGGAVGAARDIVLVNAAAALYVAGRATDLSAGMALAARAIDSGEAGRRLDALVQRSQELAA